MNVINFSKRFIKFGKRIPKQAILVSVCLINYDDISKKFLDYDVSYYEGKDIKNII